MKNRKDDREIKPDEMVRTPEEKGKADKDAAPADGDNYREIPPGSDVPAEAEVRSVEEEPMGPLLLSSIPQGFMTGSFIYLAWYTFRIGHWKIAIGVLGMWLLIMLNYECLLLARKETYPLWEVFGLCLIEGLIIQAVAWFLPTKSLRLIYFLVLGVLTLVIQIVTVIKAGLAKEKEDE